MENWCVNQLMVLEAAGYSSVSTTELGCSNSWPILETLSG